MSVNQSHLGVIPLIVARGGSGAGTFTDHGLLVGSGTGPFTALAVAATGETFMGSTGADPIITDSPSFGGSVTAGTDITATAGNIAATAGSVTAGTTVTATLGAITATNGNLVLGTAGNKIVSTSVGSGAAAGANSFGSVTLAGGTAMVSTTAVTASSLIVIWRQSIGATGAAALGHLAVGTINAGMDFTINAVQAADATMLQASDVSIIGWMIIN